MGQIRGGGAGTPGTCGSAQAELAGFSSMLRYATLRFSFRFALLRFAFALLSLRLDFEFEIDNDPFDRRFEFDNGANFSANFA